MMTPAAIYQLAIDTGFPPDTAVKMVAIAMKESSGNPRAYNGRPPDDSYGLWQINMYGALGPARLAEYGLASKDQLFDPAVNARIAFDLWNGNDRNLARHWGIEIEPYASRYRSFLPVAQLARATVEGSPGAGVVVASTPRATPSPPADFPGGQTLPADPGQNRSRPGSPAPRRSLWGRLFLAFFSWWRRGTDA